MNNPLKLVFGSLVGAGIGAAVSKVIEHRQKPGLSAAAAFSSDESSVPSGNVEALKERLVRARAAGSHARVQKEAELREQFRDKVRRADALTQPPVDG